MPYITGGNVLEKQSIWRMSIFADVFWFIINMIGLFFSSLFGDPSKSSNTTSRGRAPWGGRGGGGGSGGGGGGGPRKKPMGRINNRASLNQPMGGG